MGTWLMPAPCRQRMRHERHIAPRPRSRLRDSAAILMARLANAKIAARPAQASIHPEKTASEVRAERNCSVARTLDIVSDAWAFLIIREAFFGTRTFEAFRGALGLPRATLTDRLRKLTRLQIFRQVVAETGQRREYRLTKMGFDLYPSFVALMQFG